jgi:hypothetical protein
MNTLIQSLEESHKKRLDAIKIMIENGEGVDEAAKLCRFLAETLYNPYDFFLQKEWCNYQESVSTCYNLFHNIYHAIDDDGDICFPIVNGNPFIFFGHPHDKDFKQRVVSLYSDGIHSKKHYCELDGVFQKVDDFLTAIETSEKQKFLESFLIYVAKGFPLDDYKSSKFYYEEIMEDNMKEYKKWESFYLR